MNVIIDFGVFIDGKVPGYSFCTPKLYKLTKQAFFTRNLQGNVWNSGNLKYSELPSILSRDVKGEYFAKGTKKKARLLKVYWVQERKTSLTMAVPKFEISLMKKSGFDRVTPFRHKTTLHCAQRRAELFGHSITQHSKLYFFLYFALFCQYLLISIFKNDQTFFLEI